MNVQAEISLYPLRTDDLGHAIGIEPPEKLIKDIKQALACVAQGVTPNG
jgi:hypothetical protein